MVDRLTVARRSALMSRVRSCNTGPELLVRRISHRLGYRFRLHRKDLPGTPDLVFPKLRCVIFVHGCFWHRHTNCKKASMPKSRVAFWKSKFKRNVERDLEAARALRKMNWKVLIVWQCQLKNTDRLQAKIEKFLSQSSLSKCS